MAKNIKKIILSSFFVIPLLTTPTISSASSPASYPNTNNVNTSTKIDPTTEETTKIENKSNSANKENYGNSDYFSYSKRVIYKQSSPNFPNSKYYSEFNSKYDKWFIGNLYLERSYWDATSGNYVAYYYGNIARQE